eukprot:gene2978-5841_t
MMPPTCVLVVCGSPGSGKTFYAKEFSRYLQQNDVSPVLLSFDDLEDEFVTRTEFSFKELRAHNICKLKDIISSPITNLTHNSCNNDMTTQPSLHRVVLVDDIMFYRSMRKEIFLLAKSADCCFAIAWVAVDVDTALLRNQQRDGYKRLDDDVVRRLHNSFQPPDETCGLRSERFHLVIDGNTVTSMEQSYPHLLRLLRDVLIVHYQESVETQALVDDQDHHLNPRPNHSMEVPSSMTSRTCTTGNSIHYMDLFLRKVTSLVLQKRGTGELNDHVLSKHKQQAIAQCLSIAKAAALKSTRTRHISGSDGGGDGLLAGNDGPSDVDRSMTFDKSNGESVRDGKRSDEASLSAGRAMSMVMDRDCYQHDFWIQTFLSFIDDLEVKAIVRDMSFENL